MGVKPCESEGTSWPFRVRRGERGRTDFKKSLRQARPSLDILCFSLWIMGGGNYISRQKRRAAQTSGTSAPILSPTEKCVRQISVVKFVMFHFNLTIIA